MKVFYSVKNGDSWSSIAQHQLGDQRRFQELQKNNPKICRLELGDTLRLKIACVCGVPIPPDAKIGCVCYSCKETWEAK